MSLTIGSLRISAAPIIPVSVDAAGELDVPGADLVGWYQHSPVPGSEGAAVLASHVAYNGSPGVFRYLVNLKPGERLSVGYADGSSTSFVVTETALYGKDALPADRLWRQSGEPTLVLVTCGGRFDRDRQSYQSNVVIYASPE